MKFRFPLSIAILLPVAATLVVVLGLTLAVAGWMMAGLGALCAQLLGSAGGARGAGLALVAVSLVTMVLNHASGGYTGWAWLSRRSSRLTPSEPKSIEATDFSAWPSTETTVPRPKLS